MGSKGAVVLAAGYSSRMNEFKPLLDVGGVPAIIRVIDTLKNGGVSDIVVVTGHNREALLPIIENAGASEAYNAEYDKGMFSSISSGIKRLIEISSGESLGFFLMPVDYAAVDSDVISLILANTGALDNFAVPCYHGKKGHPLWIPRKYWDEILTSDAGFGLKSVTMKYEEDIVRIETGQESVVMDMDTQKDYEALIAYLTQGCKLDEIAGLKELAKGRRIFFVRHGQIRQHEKKIFLGSSDIPLSEFGKEQVKSTAMKLKDLDLKTDVIYCSSLTRAKETAEIIADTLNFENIVLHDGLREMSLGYWDGKFIDEIKSKYPQDFEKRGKNLLTFKCDSQAENFYDLRYRAVKALSKILKTDVRKDIVVVTHSGVIKTVKTTLAGEELSENMLKIKIEPGSAQIVEI